MENTIFTNYEKLDFSHRYKEKGYEEKYWLLLNEYFSRLKYKFSMSDEEINHKLECLLKNIDSFRYIKKIPLKEDMVLGTCDYYENNLLKKEK